MVVELVTERGGWEIVGVGCGLGGRGKKEMGGGWCWVSLWGF